MRDPLILSAVIGSTGVITAALISKVDKVDSIIITAIILALAAILITALIKLT